MAHYSFKNRFCFIHIPKNAGVSILRALKPKVPDLKRVQDDRDRMGIPRDGAFDDHFTYPQCLDTFERMHLSKQFEKIHVFCVIRNPWARMVSLYNHRLRKPRYNTPEDQRKLSEGFTAWLLGTNHRSDKVLTRKPQVEWWEGKLEVAVCQFEELNADWIMKMSRTTGVSLGTHNRGQVSQERYKAYYDAASCRHIERHFEPDIQFGGYSL